MIFNKYSTYTFNSCNTTAHSSLPNSFRNNQNSLKNISDSHSSKIIPDLTKAINQYNIVSLHNLNEALNTLASVEGSCSQTEGELRFISANIVPLSEAAFLSLSNMRSFVEQIKENLGESKSNLEVFCGDVLILIEKIREESAEKVNRVLQEYIMNTNTSAKNSNSSNSAENSERRASAKQPLLSSLCKISERIRGLFIHSKHFESLQRPDLGANLSESLINSCCSFCFCSNNCCSFCFCSNNCCSFCFCSNNC